MASERERKRETVVKQGRGCHDIISINLENHGEGAMSLSLKKW
jgi:hypothetical protein